MKLKRLYIADFIPKPLPSAKTVNKYHKRNEDNKTCMACGKSCDVLEKAHIHPLRLGGTNDASNIHLLCKTCHSDSEVLINEAYWAWFNASQTNSEYAYTKKALALQLLRVLKKRGIITDSMTNDEIMLIFKEQMDSGEFFG